MQREKINSALLWRSEKGSGRKEKESSTALKDKEDVAWVLKQRIAGLI